MEVDQQHYTGIEDDFAKLMRRTSAASVRKECGCLIKLLADFGYVDADADERVKVHVLDQLLRAVLRSDLRSDVQAGGDIMMISSIPQAEINRLIAGTGFSYYSNNIKGRQRVAGRWYGDASYKTAERRMPTDIIPAWREAFCEFLALHRAPRGDTARKLKNLGEKARLTSILKASGWIESLRTLYDADRGDAYNRNPRFPLLAFNGAVFPIWVAPAQPEEWEALDGALDELDQSRKPPKDKYAAWYPHQLQNRYDALWKTEDRKTKFNNPTYALDRIYRDEHGRYKVKAKLGWYFDSLATSELMDEELMEALAGKPDESLGLGDTLPVRTLYHEITNGRTVIDGTGRGAALSVSATMIFTEPAGGYKVLMIRRSEEVATHKGFYHIAPSGIFQPLDHLWRDAIEEYSIERSIMREYLEELFGYENLERGLAPDGGYMPAQNIMAIPAIQRLHEAEARDVVIRYCGLSVNLLTLRPEFHVLMLINKDWWDGELDRASREDHPYKFNWEYESDPDKIETLYVKFNDNFEPVDAGNIIHPATMVPNAAAGLALCTPVARAIVRGGQV